MYILHSWPDSASLIVRLVLLELGQPFEDRVIDRPNGALSSPAHLALHPLGKIPVLETPDGVMFESAAILLWLADRHGSLAPAPDSPDRARFLTWFFYTSTNIHPTLLQLFYPDREAGPTARAAVVDHAAAKLFRHVSILDRMIATEAPSWLSAEAPSILGYYLGVLMRWMVGLDPGHPGRLDLDDFPALAHVLRALETRPAALAAARAENLGTTIFTQPG
jgi:glutathione S-transferase